MADAAGVVPMKRRGVLTLIAGAGAGCLSNPPGATGPRNPPSEPANDPRKTARASALTIATFDVEEADDGRLRVFGTVENSAGSTRVARVQAVVTADGERAERTVEVDVPPGGSADFDVVFEVSYAAFTKRGNLDLNLV